MPKTFGKFERAYARLEGLILRSAHVEDVRQTSNARARVSKDEAAIPLMLRDASQRNDAGEACSCALRCPSA